VNTYGATARRHWETALPDRCRQIQDPETYFSELGEEIASRIEQQARVIAGDDPTGELYLAKVGRLNEARMAATQQVLAEMLPDPEQVDPEQSPIA
jgi:hypothetical protein